MPWSNYSPAHKARVVRSVRRISRLEWQMRNELALLAELTDADDDLHGEAIRLLEWFDR